MGGMREPAGRRPRSRPDRGDVWLADLDPVQGHEQGGVRPVLVVSVDAVNAGPSDLVAVVPITSRDRGVPSHIAIAATEGGLARSSVVICEQIRTITQRRLRRRLGTVAPETISEVERWLRVLLGL